ncbi:hypothetical protein [Sphingobium sp. CFD-2]|uniref:hypothetical protein n=1 Tax=Sphingobium sp. CFD-2 TaxID=2878542 RepID=UPI00214ADD83|nr:hypothetical protein [Sphingobium sp. CFD-2]
MHYDREESRRRRLLEKAQAEQKELEQKLAKQKQVARNAKARLLATTRSEQWHRMSLAWIDRDAGYDGEMATARVWLRNMPPNDYIAIIAKFAEKMPDATNLQVEVAAVQANREAWNFMGDMLLLDRAKQAYAADAAKFRAWQQEHPDSGWRKKPATRSQGFLISRMCAVLEIEAPTRMNRGEAHDWIERNGGNPRLVAEPDAPVSPALPLTGGASAADVAQNDGEQPA